MRLANRPAARRKFPNELVISLSAASRQAELPDELP